MVIRRPFECEKSNSLGTYHELLNLVGGKTRLNKRNAKMLFLNVAVSWVDQLSSVFRDVHEVIIQCLPPKSDFPEFTFLGEWNFFL